MSILTDNKIIRGTKTAFHKASWPYRNRGKLTALATFALVGGMAWNNVKGIDACEAAELALKNANRIQIAEPKDALFQEASATQAMDFIKANCAPPPP